MTINRAEARRTIESLNAVGSPVERGVRRPVTELYCRTTAIALLMAASKNGDAGAISLAAQLAGAAPCATCDFVQHKCRCEPPNG